MGPQEILAQSGLEVTMMPGFPARLAQKALSVGLVLAAAGCAATRTRDDPQKYAGLDRKLDRFSYLEEGKLVALGVNVEAARMREEEAFFPLAVGMANKSRTTLRVDRESFVLYDQSGRQYPLAPLSQLLSRYNRTAGDRALSTFFEIWNAKFPTFRLARSAFFPVDTAATSQDFVELPPFHYFMDYLYFPRPDGGLRDRRFELHVKTRGLDDPVFVKFLVD